MKGTEQAEQGKEKASTHHRRTQPSTSVGPSHATLSLSGRSQIAVTSLSPTAALSWVFEESRFGLSVNSRVAQKLQVISEDCETKKL
ncbi:hypothetical protein P8452_45333 [Trifolium repens]|nr:hypothetical protein P8452_45333 [Trifolium repens]